MMEQHRFVGMETLVLCKGGMFIETRFTPS